MAKTVDVLVVLGETGELEGLGDIGILYAWTDPERAKRWHIGSREKLVSAKLVLGAETDAPVDMTGIGLATR
jgi:hypothetical protein